MRRPCVSVLAAAMQEAEYFRCCAMFASDRSSAEYSQVVYVDASCLLFTSGPVRPSYVDRIRTNIVLLSQRPFRANKSYCSYSSLHFSVIVVSMIIYFWIVRDVASWLCNIDLKVRKIDALSVNSEI